MKSVLVMVPGGIEEIEEAYAVVRPDALQLHGHCLPEAEEIKAVTPGAALIRGIILSGGEASGVVEEVASFDAVLLDTHVPGKHGGTGVVHDWDTSRRICEEIRPRRLILAGGLRPSNVLEAIKKVKPYAVDVSTGVEADTGVKSPGKIRDFIERVREAKD